jgi:hypothetical protein
MVSALADQHGLKSLAIPKALRALRQFAPASLGALMVFFFAFPLFLSSYFSSTQCFFHFRDNPSPFKLPFIIHQTGKYSTKNSCISASKKRILARRKLSEVRT